jgi:hypothetical protein
MQSQVPMEQHDADYRTTVQVISDWRDRKRLERVPSMGERVLSYLVPTLWVVALVVGGAAISF